MHFMRLFWELDLFQGFSFKGNRIRILADFGRKRPSVKLIRSCPLLIPLDVQAVFLPLKTILWPL